MLNVESDSNIGVMLVMINSIV